MTDTKNALDALSDMTIDPQTNKIRVLLSISQHEAIRNALLEADGLRERLAASYEESRLLREKIVGLKIKGLK